MSGIALNKERIDWIDIAKGIGIILVVIGHLAAGNQDIKRFIYIFHMPLFFFLSGMLFNVNGIKFKEFLLKRLKSIYLPYVVFLSADYLIGFILAIKKYGFSVSLVNDIVISFIKNLEETNVPSGGGGYTLNVPLWFLCALFFSEIFLYFILKVPKKFFVFIFSIGIIGSYFIRFPLPFCISYLFPVSVFFVAGYLLKGKLKNLHNFIVIKSKGAKLYTLLAILSILLFVTLIFTYRLNKYVYMYKLYYGNIFMFYFNAFIGTFIVIFVSILIKSNKILAYFGKNSIIILCVHYYFTNIFYKLFEFLKIESLFYNPMVTLLLTAIVLVLMVPIITLVNKYFYFIFGRTRRNL